jgi:hypothetical protein
MDDQLDTSLFRLLNPGSHASEQPQYLRVIVTRSTSGFENCGEVGKAITTGLEFRGSSYTQHLHRKTTVRWPLQSTRHQERSQNSQIGAAKLSIPDPLTTGSTVGDIGATQRYFEGIKKAVGSTKNSPLRVNSEHLDLRSSNSSASSHRSDALMTCTHQVEF